MDLMKNDADDGGMGVSPDGSMECQPCENPEEG